MASAHTPRRIACLQPSATVILAAIGELERVVACTKYCADVVPELALKPRTILADSWTAHQEQINAVKPDLVIAAVPYQEKAVGEILKSGARFLGLAPRTLADIFTDIAVISGTVAASDRGEQANAAMQRRIEAIRLRTTGLARPRVFCEEWGKPLIASQPWVAELVEAAGGEFLGEPGRQISSEEAIRLDPSVSLPRGAALPTVFLWRRSSPTANGRDLRQRARGEFSASGTNTSTLQPQRCSPASKPWRSPSILNSSHARKASAKLPPCFLPQPETTRCELRFAHARR